MRYKGGDKLKKNVLFVNVGGSITDRETWSGTTYRLYKELSKHFNMDTYVIDLNKRIIDKVFVGIRRILTKEKVCWVFTDRFARKASSKLQKKIDSSNYDALFVIGSACLTYLKTEIPIIYFTDCVFSNMVNYYWFGLKDREIQEYNRTQLLALQNVNLSIATSNWAKEAIIRDYHINEKKVVIRYLGPNIETSEITHRPHEDFNILFVGIDIKRKGIDVAIECVHLLNLMDKCRHYVLHVVGGMPEGEIDTEEVKVYGYLNKKEESGNKKFEQLVEICDVFLLPTRAECVGVVFCEAAAYSIPSIAYRTGGVPDYIEDGVTGYLLDLEASAQDFANKIMTLAQNDTLFENMKRNARVKFEREMNYELLGKRIKSDVEKLLKK